MHSALVRSTADELDPTNRNIALPVPNLADAKQEVKELGGPFSVFSNLEKHGKMQIFVTDRRKNMIELFLKDRSSSLQIDRIFLDPRQFQSGEFSLSESIREVGDGPAIHVADVRCSRPASKL